MELGKNGKLSKILLWALDKTTLIYGSYFKLTTPIKGK